MNGTAAFCDQSQRQRAFCDAHLIAMPRFGANATMTGEIAAFGIAVGGTSLFCYLLMTRLQNRRRNRRLPRDGSSPDGGYYAGADAWSFSSWSGSDNPAFSTAQAIPAIQAGVIAAAMGRAAVAMAAVEAIDDSRCEGAAF